MDINMKINTEQYLQIYRLPSYDFIKNDSRHEKLYSQNFSSKIHFERSIMTLRFMLKNKSFADANTNKNKQLQKYLMGLSVIPYQKKESLLFIPKIILWDQNTEVGYYQIYYQSYI
jgi:hypothetical protein